MLLLRFELTTGERCARTRDRHVAYAWVANRFVDQVVESDFGEVAAQVQPPLIDRELTAIFINTFRMPYYDRMIGSTSTNFSNIIMIGEKNGRTTNYASESRKVMTPKPIEVGTRMSSPEVGQTNYSPNPHGGGQMSQTNLQEAEIDIISDASGKALSIQESLIIQYKGKPSNTICIQMPKTMTVEVPSPFASKNSRAILEKYECHFITDNVASVII
ncbi:putative Gag-pro [Cucumis melo var. makuwa]|uniref:Gag-pro n=1 Tax=Cucumis melo var. makuwa TaxID=1194695 RepID=A0A5D3CBF4_CUCMM|nr:putative Gag-pro [Cucumis melo var. makuwa]TYK07696.1 putative Gag-pro [Cucumis melo var. makuwa]